MTRKMPPDLIIGLMSGTSVDAIDAALVEIGNPVDVSNVRILAHHRHPWPGKLRREILAVMAPAICSADRIALLDMHVARQFASAAEHLLRNSRYRARQITAIGSHGQTIAHVPPSAKRIGSTMQIGDVSVIAALTGIPTVGDFRPADMAFGGQGAPLVPAVDALLFTDPKRTRCVHNIGGISNLTWLPAAKRRPQLPPIAFDTGPGNCLIDSLAQRLFQIPCDLGGRIASTGTIDESLLARLMRNRYFRRRPPKSTGREMFGAAMADELLAREDRPASNDLLATATEFTARSIADAYRKLLPAMPEEIIFCGGGKENKYLMARISHHLNMFGRPELRTVESFGITNAAREAMCFAVLAAMTLRGMRGNLPSCTGASQAAILGVISDPRRRHGG
ncbi:MAG: anhydro-N-acetylmuramic acid kinase [Phycisphaerae bacterium]